MFGCHAIDNVQDNEEIIKKREGIAYFFEFFFRLKSIIRFHVIMGDKNKKLEFVISTANGKRFVKYVCEGLIFHCFPIIWRYEWYETTLYAEIKEKRIRIEIFDNVMLTTNIFSISNNNIKEKDQLYGAIFSEIFCEYNCEINDHANEYKIFIEKEEDCINNRKMEKENQNNRKLFCIKNWIWCVILVIINDDKVKFIFEEKRWN